MSNRTTSPGGKQPPKGPFKSAVTGHYVSPKYAQTHPKTTFKEGKRK